MSALYGVFWTIVGVSGAFLDLRLRRRWQRREKIELGRQARRHRQIEMAERDAGQHAAARRALHKALLEQVRLDDFFDDVALVAERRRDRLDPDRTARIVFGNAAQVAAVHAVETARIDIEPQQRRVGSGGIDARQTVDCGKVADTAQQAHRDARRAA